MRVRLKDIGTVITGKTPSTKKSEFWDGDVCFITIDDINANPLIKDTNRKITKEGIESLGNNTISGTCVLVNCVGNIGVVGITELSCATNQQINSVTNIKPICNPYFLFYKLQTMSDIFEKAAGQTILKILPKTVFENIEIDLPDRKTQDKIVEILSGIDTQIERNNKLVKRLQVLGNTIYCKNANAQTGILNIQDVSKTIWGNCPSGEHILESANEMSLPYASGAGDIDNSIIVNPKAHTDKPTRIVNKNDICLSVAGTVGKIAIANDKICIGRAMLGVSSTNLYGYIYFGLLHYSNVLQKQATGAIQKIINSDHLETIDFPSYSKETVSVLNEIVDKMLMIESNTTKLVRVKKYLLPLLINGQLHI
jgi:type I restriction enzyme S subunit